MVSCIAGQDLCYKGLYEYLDTQSNKRYPHMQAVHVYLGLMQKLFASFTGKEGFEAYQVQARGHAFFVQWWHSCKWVCQSSRPAA